MDALQHSAKPLTNSLEEECLALLSQNSVDHQGLAKLRFGLYLKSSSGSLVAVPKFEMCFQCTSFTVYDIWPMPKANLKKKMFQLYFFYDIF